MIIDFIGENINGSMFQSTQNFLSILPNCSHQIAIREIILDLKSNKLKDDSLFMLTTNLIDRCSTNQNRAISYFKIPAHKSDVLVNFPALEFFPLERIHTYPWFEFRSIFGNKKIEISQVIVRVEIKRECSDSANL